MRGCRNSGVTRREFLSLAAAWLALPAWPRADRHSGFAPPYKAWNASETSGRAVWAG